MTVPTPSNEPIRSYAPGSAERDSLAAKVAEMAAQTAELPMRIGTDDVRSGETFTQLSPHRHDLKLAEVHGARRQDIVAAIEAAEAARPDWSRWSFTDRAAVFLRAADLLAGPWRDAINAATILGQSKSVHQAEIDAACELIDFLRYNVQFAQELLEDQPYSPAGMWNRMEHRPLDGFILAVTPFNFTAIAGNLPTAPAIVGNTVVWKPSEKQALAAHVTMQVLRQAGLPDGVINLVHGDGALAVEVATEDRRLGGIHFTGSHAVLRSVMKRVGQQIDVFRGFPRIVGESGGKDFVLAHPSSVPAELAVGLARGAFEYQGQKCSAASRAYIPRSLWPEVRDRLADITTEMAGSMGDVGDLGTFMGAVIDGGSFARQRDAIEQARNNNVEVLVGGGTDDSVGWFVEPTVLVTDDPRYDTMVRELFGPVLTAFVYDDADWDATIDLVDTTSDYALTGAVWSQDRTAGYAALDRLRDAAGNVYYNDKPTGSVVGQQPFGGARSSGTNDKAGSKLNMVRWISARAIKETFDPPRDWRYPHQG
ncbi:MAG: L-glutamate gamma-semialdehyde dehydrogenase [Nitriliruptor sp.]|nr:MAG: L-glutamate gamma-semialdehyde dehydrogenase [Nitriliruptor sp.]